MAILEHIKIYIDIDKDIIEKIDSDEILYL